MDPQYQFATRDEFWRLQEELKDIHNTQIAQSERIMRLEKRREDDARLKSVWNGPLSPFPGPLGGSAQQEPGYNPAAEAFRNFDADQPMGNLSLDTEDDRRRGTSRANSVRFDESAMNHYGSSRQSVDLPPMRTGSGLGSHPMSERSFSHRSDGKGSISGLSARANSFVMDSNRLGGSASGSPRVSGNPPPGFVFLGPVPSIIRCWITEAFSNDSLLYATVCTGSYLSSISENLLQKHGLQDQSFEENGSRKIRLPIYLTEATIQQSSSRSGSPAPQVPTLLVKLHVLPMNDDDRAIKVFLGSDVLRSHNADILFSQDRLLIFDEERNKVAVPLVRPENEAVYKTLATSSTEFPSQTPGEASSTPLRARPAETDHHGIIQRPSKLATHEASQTSNIVASPAVMNSSSNSEQGDRRTDQASDTSARGSLDLSRARNEDPKNLEENDKPATPQRSQHSSGVWGNSWRSNPTAQSEPKSASNYSRATQGRGMKILRPGKSMSNSNRAVSATTNPTNGATSTENASLRQAEGSRRTSQSGVTLKANEALSLPTKSNPIGQASAFGWLNSGQQKHTTAGPD
ncbi:MAG: hypothetical protein Q9160_007755 [Pyrenula sp. 1 TL-2023]